MPAAQHRVVIDLNYDGFHDRGSAHVAEIVKDAVVTLLGDSRMVAAVRIERVEESQP